jgi:hypothetical protein
MKRSLMAPWSVVIALHVERLSGIADRKKVARITRELRVK